MVTNLARASAITGIAGLIAVVSWWISLLYGGTFLGQPSEHIYNDAIALFLASIAFGIGTLIHQQEEKKGK